LLIVAVHSRPFAVMKKIAALTGIPENEKFKFTDRASTMMSKVSPSSTGSFPKSSLHFALTPHLFSLGNLSGRPRSSRTKPLRRGAYSDSVVLARIGLSSHHHTCGSLHCLFEAFRFPYGRPPL